MKDEEQLKWLLNTVGNDPKKLENLNKFNRKTMTVISASSYYPSFKISSSFEIPVSLGNLLKEIWQRHYEELYEEEADGTTSLENAFEKVLDALWSSSDLYSHRRYVWMAYTGRAVDP